jgi:hypothetical protein
VVFRAAAEVRAPRTCRCPDGRNLAGADLGMVSKAALRLRIRSHASSLSSARRAAAVIALDRRTRDRAIGAEYAHARRMLHNLRTMPLRGPANETARIATIRELLDRGYGRSRQAMEISAPAGVRIRFNDYEPPRRRRRAARGPGRRS